MLIRTLVLQTLIKAAIAAARFHSGKWDLTGFFCFVALVFIANFFHDASKVLVIIKLE